MRAIKRSQSRLEKELEGVKGVRGIGIGFDKGSKQPQLKVIVDPTADTHSLPDHIDRVRIRYDLIDDVKLY